MNITWLNRYSLLLALIAVTTLVAAREGNPQTSDTQDPEAEQCPTISVACPDDREPEIAFTVKISEVNPDRKLTYKWSITRGEIKSGQGTSKIILEAKRDGSGIGASVEVLGLPAKCANLASCHVSHF